MNVNFGTAVIFPCGMRASPIFLIAAALVLATADIIKETYQGFA
jgi:hypothetical protein